MKKKDKGRKNFFKNNYLKSWDYICESKNFIYLIMAIFFIFVLIGFFLPSPDFLSEQILKFIQELIGKVKGLSLFGLIKFIFLNNLQGSFFAMIFGFLLGIFPLSMVIANGYLLGFVSSMSVEGNGFLVLWKILPHGIFELPAIFISLGLGLKFGTFIFQKEKIKSFKEFFENSLRVFLFIIVPLLIIAAILEGILIFFLG